MNMQHIETLMYNPFYLSKVIQSFLTGYEKDLDFKTTFYVLPIVMYRESRNRLLHANSRSTLYSIFSKDVKFEEYNSKINSKFSLSQVTKMFNEYIEITKQSIIILENQKKIKIYSKIVLVEKFHYTNTPNSIKEYFRSAYYLGQILSDINLEEFENFLEI